MYSSQKCLNCTWGKMWKKKKQQAGWKVDFFSFQSETIQQKEEMINCLQEELIKVICLIFKINFDEHCVLSGFRKNLKFENYHETVCIPLN